MMLFFSNSHILIICKPLSFSLFQVIYSICACGDSVLQGKFPFVITSWSHKCCWSARRQMRWCDKSVAFTTPTDDVYLCCTSPLFLNSRCAVSLWLQNDQKSCCLPGTLMASYDSLTPVLCTFYHECAQISSSVSPTCLKCLWAVGRSRKGRDWN